MSNSRIYNWIALGIATVIAIPIIIFLITEGVFTSEACLGAIVAIIGIWCAVYFVSFCIAEDKLSKKYEYALEDYIYHIRKDVLASGEVRFYPIVLTAKYGIEQYIEHLVIDKKVYWELTRFESKRDIKHYGEPKSNVTIFYDSEVKAKKAIESFKAYTAKKMKEDKDACEKYENERKGRKVVSSEYISL